MKLLDMYTGTGSVAKVAREMGFEVTTLDIDPLCEPNVCVDVMTLSEGDIMECLGGHVFDVIWASPPCETFSSARRCNVGRVVKGHPMTHERILADTENIGVPLLRKTQDIIHVLKPKIYFIENPYTGSMKNYIAERPAVYDYCMYGFPYKKSTAIWSNLSLTSKRCDRSHLEFGRHRMTAIGSSKKQTGQGGGNSKKGRYAIPEALVRELLNVNVNEIK